MKRRAVEQSRGYPTSKAVILNIHPCQVFALPKKFRNASCEIIAGEKQRVETGKQAKLWRDASLKIVVAKNNSLKGCAPSKAWRDLTLEGIAIMADCFKT